MSIFSGISANSDYQSPLSERVRRDRRYVDLVKSKRLRSLADDVAQGLGLAAFITAAVVIPYIIYACNN